MKLGAYTACLHDRPLPDALKLLAELGLTSAEINAGGFLPAPHLPIEEVRRGGAARDSYLGEFARAGIALTGLNVNGNPLHPDPEVGPKHADDLRTAIELAGLLGVRRIVAMSGLPAAQDGGRYPSWVVNPWDSGHLDVLDYQWNQVAIPFWRDIDARARDNDVKVCIEMHPHNLVFNPATLRRLVDEVGAKNVGAELDPSHLFWQGIDPVAAVEWLGGLVYHAAAKDTRINEQNRRIYGVLDDRFQRVPAQENPTGLGGRYTLNRWPADPAW
ncbi:MAG TPA: sugar phosphate isomerase/epimerase, partial [Micromonosporaceae bacterium]|nr:sugar phosphate isomerase/epimerase [Micromonosporaceae bacterium]